MQFGDLNFQLVTEATELVAKPTQQNIKELGLDEVWAAEIDETLSDTANFCERYHIERNVSANCVIVEAKRASTVRYAACIILATTKADVNGAIRRHLDARSVSFAPIEIATSLTHMEYGGITPVGLPVGWPILIDSNVNMTKTIIIGSGLRKSKLLVPGSLLATLPEAVVLDIAKR